VTETRSAYIAPNLQSKGGTVVITAAALTRWLPFDGSLSANDRVD